MQGHHLSIHVPCHPVWPEPVACSQVRRSRWRADLKGLGLKPCRYVCVEIWASAPEGTRTSSQHRSPSVAKATIRTAAYGTAEAVPLQGKKPRAAEDVSPDVTAIADRARRTHRRQEAQPVANLEDHGAVG